MPQPVTKTQRTDLQVSILINLICLAPPVRFLNYFTAVLVPSKNMDPEGLQSITFETQKKFGQTIGLKTKQCNILVLLLLLLHQ